MRLPSAVSHNWRDVPGFCITQGTRVIDSTPSATTMSASPACTALAAASAVSPDVHSRLTV
jgi:hypothetical protein